MNKTIIVTYASKHGATAEIAKKIGEVLTHAGYQTALAEAKTVGDLSPYWSVVMGSAVYYGKWRQEAVKLFKTNQQTLAKKPTWLFSSGPTGEGDPLELLNGWRFPPNLQEITDRIQPRDIAVFHGALDPDKLNFFEKWILNNVKSPVGDFRDWDTIISWTKSIAEALQEIS